MARSSASRPPEVLEMARTWDRLAASDPMHFIATSQRGWSAEAFYESGREVVRWVLDWMGPDVARHRALEIGCGLGRTAVHLARAFDQVDGIDISPEMIRAAGRQDLPPNVRLVVGSGRDLQPFEQGRFDLVFSTLVFQHIPCLEVIAGYVQEVARVLRPAGAAVLQFDTRRRGLISRAYASWPDAFLPAARRRHVRRYRRDPETLGRMFDAAGLGVAGERGAGTASHFVRLVHADPGRPAAHASITA